MKIYAVTSTHQILFIPYSVYQHGFFLCKDLIIWYDFFLSFFLLLDYFIGMAMQQDDSGPGVYRNAKEGKKLAAGINQFAWDLYSQMSSAKPKENVFFSPTSVAIALGMTYLGARENTATEMMKVRKLFESKLFVIPCKNIQTILASTQSIIRWNTYQVQWMYTDNFINAPDLSDPYRTWSR